MSKEFKAMFEIVSYLLDSIETYENLRNTYDNISFDKENSNRCSNYILCFERVMLEFNEYYKRFDEVVAITEYMNSNSVIWHLQRFIGSEIDSIISYGFHYVMRDSENLKAQYKCYCMIYDVIVSICDDNKVYY